MPQPDADKTLAWFNMHVITRRMNVLAYLVAELDADVGLVRRFVLAETDVAVDAHQRATHLLRQRAEMLRDRGHLIRHIGDEIQRRGAHEIFVILLVCLEPLAGVVRGEGGEEGEGLFGEITIGHLVGSLVESMVWSDG